VTRGGWQTYDSVAEAYDRTWRPNFEGVARDLVEVTGVGDLRPDATVLDVGTGTGAAGLEAARHLPDGVVVGVDPSLPMLALARANAPLRPVAAESPGLPFPPGTFDAAVANLVLSHFEQYDTSLADIVRVLRPGGRFGVTAWGSVDDEPVDDGHQRELTGIWKSVAGRFVDPDAAADAIEAALRWEGWFGDPARLRGALEGSGLRGVALHGRVYLLDVSQREMLAGYETSFWGRYVRNALDAADWQRFRHDVAEMARVALPDPITRVDQLMIGVGTKRFDTRP
jgi:ubiquinone/menaquinone biosynthesis C-methylase UbiE